MMHTSLEAATRWQKKASKLKLIDLRTLLQLMKRRFLHSVKKTNKCLVVHKENTKTGGIAGEIAAILCEKAFGDLDGPVIAVTFAGYAGCHTRPRLEEHFLPS